jgi:ABC-type bacteriocin/lantibiotic exporter with double-glycine peptidase domain
MISYYKKLKQKLSKDMLYEMWQEAKWMSQYTRKYWKAIVYYIFLGVLGSGMGLIGSIASKYLIDAVTGYDSTNIRFIITVIICMALGNIIVRAATSRISTKISLKVNNEIQADVFDRIMNTDWESMSEYHSGDLLNRVNGDVKTVADSVLGWIPSLITRIVQFVGTLIVILYYDRAMAIIALLSAPVTMIMSRMLMTRMRDFNKKVREVSSEMISFHEEAFQNVQTIKCFDLINFFGHRLRNVQSHFAITALDYNKFSIYTSSFMSVIGMVVSYATFGWGVYRLWSGFITYGTMTLFLQLSGGLSSGFSALVGMVPSAIGATTSAGRIMAVVELPREKHEDKELIDEFVNNPKDLGLAVQLSQVDFHYKGRKLVLQDADFYAKPKEIVAIVGPSGEGKTTLIRILLGLLNPVRGEAKIVDGNGVNVKISAATRKFFSYVPQGNTIFSGTVADNLRMVRPQATDEELLTALKAACALDFVEALPNGIYTKVGEKGIGFSEGQSQRLSIARALLRDAPIILLDEATSALDAETEKNVLLGVMSYGRTRTCILTTHRRSVLAECDRIYQINDTVMMEYNGDQNYEIAVNF